MITNSNADQQDFIEGFDYLRVFFTFTVVVLHSYGLSFISDFGEFPTKVVEVIYNFCLLAVPVFITMSLLLFYKKIDSDKYFFYRLRHLTRIYLSWMFLGAIFNAFFHEPGARVSLFGILKTLISGTRPELFFLFSLIFCTVITFLNYKLQLNLISQFLLLLFSSILLYVFCYLSILTGNPIFCVYWNPLNFLPYIFSAYIINDLTKKHGNSYFINQPYILYLTLLFFYILLSIIEWRYLSLPLYQPYNLPPYTRFSLVIGSNLIILLALNFKRKAGSYISILSRNTQGIYLTHAYVIDFISFTPLPSMFDKNINSFIRSCIVFVIAYLVSINLKKITLFKSII